MAVSLKALFKVAVLPLIAEAHVINLGMKVQKKMLQQ
jgi:hypothetical protein